MPKILLFVDAMLDLSMQTMRQYLSRTSLLIVVSPPDNSVRKVSDMQRFFSYLCLGLLSLKEYMFHGVYAKTMNARNRVLKVKYLNARLEHVLTQRSVLFKNVMTLFFTIHFP